MGRKALSIQKEEELFIKTRDRAAELLQDSSMEQLLKDEEVQGDETAEAALKAIVADRIAEYVVRARNLTKKRRMKRLGAAAIIIAAER